MIKPPSGDYIPNENFGALVLVEEILIQCSLFTANIVRLEDAADHWMRIARSQDFDRKVPPIDILTWATVCLSAMAAIRRLIITGGQTSKSKERSKVLYELLQSPTLPTIASAAVRNAWEHLDERLDDILPTMKSGGISLIHVTAEDVPPNTIALKRFDPRTLTLYFSNEGIPLREAALEIVLLTDRVNTVHSKLTKTIIRPWV